MGGREKGRMGVQGAGKESMPAATHRGQRKIFFPVNVNIPRRSPWKAEFNHNPKISEGWIH